MPNKQHEPGRFSRRSFLGAVGSASVVGIAGCSQSDDEGNNGDGGNGGDGGSEFTCTDLGSVEYAAYDAGETPMICDWEVPKPFLDTAEVTTGVNGMTHGGAMPYTMNGTEYSLNVTVTQLGASETSVKSATRRARDDLEAIAAGEVPGNHEKVGQTTQYAGETVELYEDSSYKESDALRAFGADLPHELDGYNIYIFVSFRVGEATQTEAPEDCLSAMREAALQIGKSATVNDETTLKSEIVPYWDDWPWDFL